MTMQVHYGLIHNGDVDLMLGLKNNHPGLTGTELRIVALIERKFTSREIAGLLGCSIRNVDNHRYRIGKKLKARDRRQGISVG